MKSGGLLVKQSWTRFTDPAHSLIKPQEDERFASGLPQEVVFKFYLILRTSGDSGSV